MFITSLPTLLPSKTPVVSSPTLSPSFIGLVISVEITQTTTTAIDNVEVAELELLVAQSYGVDIEDISSTTEYVTTGTLAVTIPDTISEAEALEDLTTALSLTLSIDEENIFLSLDPETGEVEYIITTNNFDQTNTALLELQNDDIIENIDTNIISISSVSPSAEIVAEVSILLNADEVETSLQQAQNRVNAMLDDNYDSDISGNVLFEN